MRPAGFWIRAVALAIDVVVCVLVEMSFGVLVRVLMGSAGYDSSAHSTAFLFTAIFAAAYWTTLHMVAGQTLGKAVVGIRVVGTDGALLTFGPAFLRYLASGLSVVPLGFGYLMAALRRDKRALHDLIAGSRVERPVAPPHGAPGRPPGAADRRAAAGAGRAAVDAGRAPAARGRPVARVLATLPLRVRNRLASTIVAALGDEHARCELRALAADDTTARDWLAPDEGQWMAALRERARRAAGALADRPALGPDADLGQTLQAAGLLFDAGLHFEVHEALEPHWMAAAGDTREALQGLIQIAVGFQHLATATRRRPVAARRGSGRLHQRRLAGVELDPFARAAVVAAERVEAGEPIAVPSFPEFSRR